MLVCKNKSLTLKYLNTLWRRALILPVMFACAFNIFSQNNILPDSIPLGKPLTAESEVITDRVIFNGDSTILQPVDTVPVLDAQSVTDSINAHKWDVEWVRRQEVYNPDPTRAVWMAALFPGLGQVYNRRYWKLPIIVGGYLGLAYATNWNNTMLRDYTRAFADITDNDPSTKSYMDFFPSTTKEENLDKQWLTNLLKSRKNFYRRNRDLCIIGMIGVYLLAVVDAYVDASLAHFDISPDLAVNWSPSIIPDSRGQLPAFGLNWSLCF